MNLKLIILEKKNAEKYTRMPNEKSKLFGNTDRN